MGMRCPECERLMRVSFISDTDPKHRVYQCSTAGVRQYTGHRGSTTDHSDRYFVQERPAGPLTRVKPVDLGASKRKSLGGNGMETYHRWAFQSVTVIKGKAA